MSKTLNVINHVLKNGYEYETSPFGLRKDPFTKNDSFHNGEDMISSKYGTDYIIAYQDGTVTAVRNSVSGFDKTMASGNYIYIDHASSYQTRYLHLKKDSLLVKVGQAVKKGEIIAYMGTTGYSTGDHLHFEVRLNGTVQDPIQFLCGDKEIPGSQNASDSPEALEKQYEIGEIVFFQGGYHYSNAQSLAPIGGMRTAGKAKITGKAMGNKHPYHLIGIKDGSNVYGWVDTSTFTGSVTDQQTSNQQPTNFGKGDVVQIKHGAKWYNGNTIPSWVLADTWIVYQDQIEDRVIINKNISGKNAIMSPIHAADLIKK